MHYTVYVLIPRDTKNIEEEVLGLMDPYCEDNDAEETDMRCLCVEGRFTKEFHEQLLRDFGEPRILWKGLMEDKVSDGGEILWNSIPW
jgi:hypothetical protein